MSNALSFVGLVAIVHVVRTLVVLVVLDIGGADKEDRRVGHK